MRTLATVPALSPHVHLSLDQGCSALAAQRRHQGFHRVTISVCMCTQQSHFDQWKFMQVSGERETIRERARASTERGQKARAREKEIGREKATSLHVFCNRTLCASVRALA
jgi:hypothetical protein